MRLFLAHSTGVMVAVTASVLVSLTSASNPSRTAAPVPPAEWRSGASMLRLPVNVRRLCGNPDGRESKVLFGGGTR